MRHCSGMQADGLRNAWGEPHTKWQLIQIICFVSLMFVIVVYKETEAWPDFAHSHAHAATLLI